jgi:CubicO group peptidase (beta-lactamase class C family)
MKKPLALALLLWTSTGIGAELTGLWKAKKRFGPDTRGTVIVTRSGDAYTADVVGRRVAVTSANGELTFAAPDGSGKFRGQFDGAKILRGRWYRSGTPLYSFANGAPVGASPVALRPDGPDRWRGDIDPDKEAFTFYLLLQPQADGSFHAILRNPEFDLGSRQGVERLSRDGNALKLIGKRSGKEIDVATGTYDAENDTITLGFPDRGGTYDFLREGDDSAFYPRGKKPGRYAYRKPIALDDGWAVASLDDLNIDRPAIERFVQNILETPMDSNDAPQVHGLLIARHGKLVLEEYFHDQTRDTLHTTRSASKSLTAITVGAAMHAGVPLALSSRVYEVMNDGTMPADVEPQKRLMTLEHLLTMSSGYFCDDTNDSAPGNEETMWDQNDEPDFYRYTMKVPLATPPGENSVYCSASANLALGMAGRAAHEDPMSLFARLVAEPMKMRRYEWGLDHAEQPYGGGSLHLLLRDFIKSGQLMLNHGVWNGHRILSADFAERATSKLYHMRNIYYGFLWWSEDLPYKNRIVQSYSARGAGGQSVTVVPELDLVVATFAGNFSSRKGMFAASTDPVPQFIMPAVREPGDDKSAPVLPREFISPYGASKDGSRVKKSR